MITFDSIFWQFLTRLENALCFGLSYNFCVNVKFHQILKIAHQVRATGMLSSSWISIFIIKCIKIVSKNSWKKNENAHSCLLSATIYTWMLEICLRLLSWLSPYSIVFSSCEWHWRRPRYHNNNSNNIINCFVADDSRVPSIVTPLSFNVIQPTAIK